jgi:hypothetical protein
MWLDEILITLRAQGSLTETWHACQANAEHPPLPALVMSVGNTLGFNEHMQRLIPVVLGVATVVLLAKWSAHRFGLRVGLLAGFLCALSPFHIRYSQELRPYSYLLFFALLTLVIVDRLSSKNGWCSTLLCALAICGGLYSHNLFLLIFLPVVLLLIGATVTAFKNNSSCYWVAPTRFVAACLLAFLVYLPWLSSVIGLAQRSPEGNAIEWAWGKVAQRCQFLTVGGYENASLDWGGTTMLFLVILGAIIAARRWEGVITIVGGLAGSVGIELFMLLVIERWTKGRYDIMGWPFLVVLSAVALDYMFDLRPRRAIGFALVGALAIAHFQGIAQYQIHGRCSWDLMTRIVMLVRQPGEKVFTSNKWGYTCLRYYIEKEQARIGSHEKVPVVLLKGNLKKLTQLWPNNSSCLLVRSPPYDSETRRLSTYFPRIARLSNTGEVYRLTKQGRALLCSMGHSELRPCLPTQPKRTMWADPSLRLLPRELQENHSICLGGLWPSRATKSQAPGPIRIEFDDRTIPSLRGGWAKPSTGKDGTTFAWAMGLESGIVFTWEQPRSASLAFQVRPFEVPGYRQQIRGYLNGKKLGRVTLRPGPQRITVELSPDHLQQGENLLVFQFSYFCSPAQVRTSSKDSRPLAAAFDWLEIK